MSVTVRAIEHQPVRGLKRAEYDRLVELGAFERERVELVFGQVVEMSPMGDLHWHAVRILHEKLVLALHGRAAVASQLPFNATDDSEPEPDVYVAPLESPWHGKPSRAHLIIEVSDSSQAYDRGEKALLYALSDVDEYWIVDLEHGCVEVRRDRRDGRWRSLETFHRGDAIALLAFPDVAIDVADVLPPVSE